MAETDTAQASKHVFGVSASTVRAQEQGRLYAQKEISEAAINFNCVDLFDQASQKIRTSCQMVKQEPVLSEVRLLEATTTPTAATITNTNRWSVELSTFNLSEAAVELAVYFVALTFCMVLLLNEVGGEARLMRQWLLYRKLDIFVGYERNSARVASLLKAGAFFYIVMPFVCLGGWIGLLIYDTMKEKASFSPTIAAFCVALFFLILILSFMGLIWNKYLFTSKAAFGAVLSFGLLTAYQGIVVFYNVKAERFLPFSGFFLNITLFIMAMYVYVRAYEDKKTMKHFIDEQFQPCGRPLNSNRDADILEEIEKQKKDPNWRTTQEEMDDVLTMKHVSKDQYNSAIGLGSLQAFQAMSAGQRFGIKTGLFVSELAILAVYSWMLWYYDDGSKLGIFISVSTICMDIFTYMAILSKLVTTPPAIVALLALNRVLMVVLGQRLWIYGVMGLYMLYGIFLVLEVAKDIYPVNTDVLRDRVTIAELCTAKGRSEIFTEGLSPTLLLIIVNIFYAIIMVSFESIEFKGKIKASITLYDNLKRKDGTYSAVKMNLYEAGGTSILIVLSFFFIAALARLLVRKASRTERGIQAKALKESIQKFKAEYKPPAEGEDRRASCFQLNDAISCYIVVTWIVCLIWTAAFYRTLSDVRILLWGALGSLSIMFFARAYAYLALNGFAWYVDVAALNKRIKNHNEDIKARYELFKAVRAQLVSGDIVIPAYEESQPGLQKAGTLGQSSINAPIADQAEEDPVEEDQEEEQAAAPAEKEDEYDGEADDMYDGGDAIQLGGIQLQLEDLNEPIEIDLDEAEDLVYGNSLIAVSCLRPVKDWQAAEPKKSFTAAYTAGELRPNDYSFYRSVMIGFGAWVGLLVGLLLTGSGNLGAVSAVPLIYAVACFVLANTVIYQSRAFSAKELGFWITVQVLYLANGIAFFFMTYGQYFEKFQWDVSKRPKEQFMAARFFLMYILLAPTLAHAVVCALRLADRGFTDFWKDFKVFLIGFALFMFFMLLAVFLFVHWTSGLAFLGAALYAIFLVAYGYMRITIGKTTMSPWWSRINRFILFIGISIGGIWSIFDKNVSVVEGMSITTAGLLALLWSFALFHAVKDSYELNTRPVYYSANIVPIFKYHPESGRVISHYNPSITAVAGFFVLAGWAFFVNTQVKPDWFGVLLIIGVEILALVSYVRVKSVTIESVNNVHKYLNDNIAKAAWLDAKKALYSDDQAFSRADAITYRRLWSNWFQFRNYVNTLNDDAIEQPDDSISQELKEEVMPAGGTDPKDFYKMKVAEWMPNPPTLEQESQLAFIEFDLKRRVDAAYIEEMSMVPNFFLLAIMGGAQDRIRIHKEYLRFLEEKQQFFNALGIDLFIPGTENGGSAISGSDQIIEVRYEIVKAATSYLTEDQVKLLKGLHAYHMNEKQSDQAASQDAKKKKDEDIARKQEEAARRKEEKERKLRELMEQMAEQKRLREEQQQQQEPEQNQEDPEAGGGRPVQPPAKKDGIDLEGVDINDDPNDMPDCVLKYKLIMARAKAGMGKFEDTQFFGDNDALGQKVLNDNLSGQEIVWPRMSEPPEDAFDWKVKEKEFNLFRDGASSDDVMQQMLGDCYYLSAIAILGDQETRDKFVIVTGNIEEWKECGAFCVMFYEVGEPDYVIVDDKLPMDASHQFVFTKTRSGNEIWPQILEKAYAKKYGSYAEIEGGFVDLALAELTNGIPQTLKHAEFPNQANFFEKLQGILKMKNRLGGGTPSHPEGDRAKSNLGIVQGHAYSVLDVVQADSYRLIKVRNPWGQGEWKGAWSDKSTNWTTRMRNIVGFKEEHDADDGVFWMEFSDYLTEFEETYVCSDYTEHNGWYNVLEKHRWEGEYSAGLPTAKNRGAIMSNNPQIGVTLSKPSPGFIVLRLKDKENAYKAKLYGYLNMQAAGRGGDLITRPDKAKQLTQMGPTNMALQAKEIEFPDNVEYPYTFTILVANMEAGEDGEGDFSVQVFAKDKSISIKRLN